MDETEGSGGAFGHRKQSEAREEPTLTQVAPPVSEMRTVYWERFERVAAALPNDIFVGVSSAADAGS